MLLESFLIMDWTLLPQIKVNIAPLGIYQKNWQRKNSEISMILWNWNNFDSIKGQHHLCYSGNVTTITRYRNHSILNISRTCLILSDKRTHHTLPVGGSISVWQRNYQEYYLGMFEFLQYMDSPAVHALLEQYCVLQDQCCLSIVPLSVLILVGNSHAQLKFIFWIMTDLIIKFII